MEKYLRYFQEDLKRMQAEYTAKEIDQQPELWLETLKIIETNKTKLQAFLKEIDYKNCKIILTGAGSSEFIGNCAEPLLKRNQLNVQSIATTDIVANPREYLNPDEKTLLISFARSGNSPESVASVKLANEIVKDIYHIFITCNSEGQLAKMIKTNKKNCMLLLMPKEANDQSFTMTASFTCMLVAVLKIFNLNQENYFRLDSLIIAANDILTNKLDAIKKLADIPCSQVIFLGSAALKAISQESSLKIIELTQGEIANNFNSILGFRHGPKAAINDSTIVFVLCSVNPYTRKYDLDLINELVGEAKSRAIVLLDGKNDSTLSKKVNHYFSMDQSDLTDKELALLYILLVQIYSFYKSVNLNFSPDNPSPTGEVNRVVKGVNIYKL